MTANPDGRSRPPLLARLLLRACLRAAPYEAISGDLEEEYHSRATATGRRAARRRYRRQALASLLSRLRPQRPDRRLSSPESDRSQPMQDLLLDLKFALRGFLRTPGVSTTVVVTLALGIGATTAIFSVLDSALLRPLPYADAHELVAVYEENLPRGLTRNQASPANFLSWRERSQLLDDITVHGWTTGWALTRGSEAAWVRGTQVYFNFFDVLGAAPQLGRGFLEQDNYASTDSVIISDGLWRRAFGGEASLVGEQIELDGRSRTVVGIAPPGFSYPEPGLDIWSPIRWQRESLEQEWFRRAHFVWAVGRLAPDRDADEADSEIGGIAAALAQEFPRTNENYGAGVMPLRDWVVGDARASLLVLAGAVGAVLLIACANIANLLLARASGRGQEMAVRSALGAGRLRIARQLLTESTVLALVGGTIGVLCSILLTRWIVTLAGDAIPRAHEVGLDLRVLGFGLLTTVLAGLAFGLVPALQLSVQGSLAGGPAGRASGSRPAVRARHALVVVEVALAVVLVAGAGLMLRSLMRLSSVDPGFDTTHLLATEIELPGARYPDGADAQIFFETLVQRLEARPGIISVGLADSLPIEGTFWTSDFFVEGRDLADDGDITEFNRRIVDPGYFTAMDVPILRGRAFDSRDAAGAPLSIIVNDTLARRYFPGLDPLGARIRFGDDDDDPWHTVIGIAGSTKVDGLDSREWPEILLAASQLRLWRATLLTRYGQGTARPDELFRTELEALDPLLPVIRMERYQEIVASTIVSERLLATLLGGFAALALMLAVLGIYGVLAYVVARQTHEIGIRMALGARPPDVVGLVLRRAAGVVVTGLLAGVLLYAAAARLLQSVLFEISPTDPITLAAVLGALAGAGLLAAYLPARRASRVDPLSSLRAD